MSAPQHAPGRPMTYIARPVYDVYVVTRKATYLRGRWRPRLGHRRSARLIEYFAAFCTG
jgi:hypothetical protein